MLGISGHPSFIYALGVVKSFIFICKNKKKAEERHSANEGGGGHTGQNTVPTANFLHVSSVVNPSHVRS